MSCSGDDDFPPGNPSGPPGQGIVKAEPEIVPKDTKVKVKDIPSSKPSKQGGFLDIFKKT